MAMQLFCRDYLIRNSPHVELMTGRSDIASLHLMFSIGSLCRARLCCRVLASFLYGSTAFSHLLLCSGTGLHSWRRGLDFPLKTSCSCNRDMLWCCIHLGPRSLERQGECGYITSDYLTPLVSFNRETD